MKNISGQYRELLEGKMTQAQFLRNARMIFPNYVTNHNSFQDSVAILKQKGMLVEGDAVKGTPDKEPTYDSPTPDVKTKYKKVEQSPEVSEQDGIYPATTLTDIPKIKTNKKVKNESDGLEPIKDNDTKNEMKKVKVVKENFDNNKKPISKINTATNFEEWIDALDAADTKEVLQSIYYELGKPIVDIAKIALKKTAGFIGGQDVRDDLNNKDRVDEATKIAPDTQAVITLLSKQPMILQKISLINNKEELQPVFDFLLTKINPGFAKGTAQIRTATNQTLTAREKTKPTMTIAERLKPAITKLVQEVLDEMGQK